MRVTSVVFGLLLVCVASLALEQDKEPAGLSGLPPQTEQPSTDVEQSQPNIRQKRGLLLGLLGAKALLGVGVLGAGVIGAKAVGAGLVGGAIASKVIAAKSYGGGYGGYGGGYGVGYGRGYGGYGGGYGGYGGGYGGDYHIGRSYGGSQSYYYVPQTYIIQEGW